MASLTFTLKANIDGYTGELAIHANNLDMIRAALTRLEQAGIQPMPTDWARTPEGDPICPKHLVPMRKREKQGDVWYSHNIGTDDDPCYCRGYPGPSSPGYSTPLLPQQSQEAEGQANIRSSGAKSRESYGRH